MPEELEFMRGRVLVMGKGSRPPAPVEERFQAKLLPRNKDGCSIWIGATSKVRSSGTLVGRILYKDRVELAHKVMWAITTGSLPKHQIIPTACKNYLCMTFEHWEERKPRVYMRTRAEIQEEARINRLMESNVLVAEDLANEYPDQSTRQGNF